MFLKAKEHRNRSFSDVAFFTRFIPMRFIPDIDYFEKLTSGKEYFKIVPRIKRVDVFDFPDYLKAHKIYWTSLREQAQFEFFEKNPFDRGALARFLQDLVRLSAYVASLEDRHEIQVDDFEVVNQFLPMMLANYISPNLTEREQAVLARLPKKQSEIAEEIGVSEAYVSKVMLSLRKMGMIK